MGNKENQELDDDVMVTIELDGEDLDCEILTIFDIEDQDYIVLLPVDENGEPKVMLRTDNAGKTIMGRGDGGAFFATDNLLVAGSYASDETDLYRFSDFLSIILRIEIYSFL